MLSSACAASSASWKSTNPKPLILPAQFINSNTENAGINHRIQLFIAFYCMITVSVVLWDGDGRDIPEWNEGRVQDLVGAARIEPAWFDNASN